MAHLITKSDRFGEMQDNGNRAWHGLGSRLPRKMKAVEAGEHLGILWPTELQPVRYNHNGIERIDGDSFVHIRGDNGDVLGIVSNLYKPIQNIEVARFADEVADEGEYHCETAGTLIGGRRVFFLLDMAEPFKVGKNDEVRRYLAVSNGHGGFAAFACYPTSVRIVCNNTLRASESQMGAGLKFRHTGDMEGKAKLARMVLGLAKKETKRFEEQVRALANADLSNGQMRAFMDMAFEKEFGKVKDMDKEEAEKATARRDRIIEVWMENLANERQTLPGIQGTAWAAFNAVTEWYDHQRGTKHDTDITDSRVHSNVFGAGADAKRKLFKAALAFAQ